MERVHRNASEYHLNHCHMEKGESITHPRPLPAALFQHIVLSISYLLTACSVPSYQLDITWIYFQQLIKSRSTASARLSAHAH